MPPVNLVYSKRPQEYIPEICINMLNAELTSVIEELNPLLDESRKEPGSLDERLILALLEKLETMLEQANPEVTDSLDDIRAIPGSDKLVDLIEDYNFDAAITALEELRKVRG